jgi:hypothetical protein
MLDEAHADPIEYIGFHGVAATMAVEALHRAIAKARADGDRPTMASAFARAGGIRRREPPWLRDGLRRAGGLRPPPPRDRTGSLTEWAATPDPGYVLIPLIELQSESGRPTAESSN